MKTVFITTITKL